MKSLTIINIERAIKDFESAKNYKFNVSEWDLACHIFNYIKEEQKGGEK